MGAWGVKALESDEGLDIQYDIMEYAKYNELKISLENTITHLVSSGMLPEDEGEVDFLYDHGTMALAEMLLSFVEDGKYIYTDFNGDEEKELILREFDYTEEGLDFLLRELCDILEPAGEEHETYELWEESDSFSEWEAHVKFLIEGIEKLREEV